MNEGLKIIKGVVENFKNISQKEVVLNGRSMVILGKNSKGKSSLVQALLSPVDSRLVPAKPIKDGETKAHTGIEIAGNINGEAKKYIIDIYYSEGIKSRIVLKDQDGGEVKNAKSVIDSLVGNIGFDIFDFLSKGVTKDGNVSKAGVKEQIDILKSFLDQKDVVALDNADKAIKQAKDDKNYCNKRYKEIEVELKGNPYSPEEIKEYSEPKDPKIIQEKIQNISKELQKYSEVESGIKEREDEREKAEGKMLTRNTKEEVAQLMDRLTELIDKYSEFNFLAILEQVDSQLKYYEQLKSLQEEIDKGKTWLSKRERPDVSVFNEQLEKIHEHNRHNEKVKALEEKHIELSDYKKKYEKAKKDVDEHEAGKKKIFSSASLPVKGLSFDEDGIWYQKPGDKEKLPFRDDQIPKSTLIAIGLKIAMAMNPNLKVLRIQDGESLDKDTLNTVIKVAEKEGYQLLIEKVSDDYDNLEIEFIEKEL